MQEAGFDKNLNVPRAGGLYIKLTAKGEKIRFIIAAPPKYETKHWIGDKESVLCDKYNSPDNKTPCTFCDQWQAMRQVAGDDKKQMEVANKLKPQATFFYPILNLNNNTAGIFQTAPSVHWTIVGYKDDGVDVFGCAWGVERTEVTGNYYVTRRLDKVDLTEEQEEALEKAKGLTVGKGKESHTVVEDIPSDTTGASLADQIPDDL